MYVQPFGVKAHVTLNNGFINSPITRGSADMPKDVHTVIEELRRMPLRGIITMKAEYVRQILEYITELEAK